MARITSQSPEVSRRSDIDNRRIARDRTEGQFERLHRRSLAPLLKARDFGKTPLKSIYSDPRRSRATRLICRALLLVCLGSLRARKWSRLSQIPNPYDR